MGLNAAFPKLFGGRTKFQGTNPADFKDQLVMGGAEENAIRRKSLNSLGMFQDNAIAGVKQQGAANRLPEGATQSAIAGTARGANDALAKLEPQIAGAKRGSLAEYLKMQMGYDQAKMAHETGNANQNAAFNQGALGNIGQWAMLWNSGLLNNKPAGAQ